jgi:SAM-dependent methyltransferase
MTQGPSRLSPKRLVNAVIASYAQLPPNSFSRAIRSFAEPLKGPVKRALASCNLYTPADDRRILEEVILDYFAKRSDLRRVLFVGCESYTARYGELFKDKDYWTLDYDPKKSGYGAAQHVVDSVANVRQRFEADSFDLILCNGVFGWGLNDRSDVEAAVLGCYECLRDDGHFLLGWNDLPAYRPFPIQDCQNLRRFRPFVFEPLSTAEYRAAGSNRHVFNFYVKPSK